MSKRKTPLIPKPKLKPRQDRRRYLTALRTCDPTITGIHCDFDDNGRVVAIRVARTPVL